MKRTLILSLAVAMFAAIAGSLEKLLFLLVVAAFAGRIFQDEPFGHLIVFSSLI